MLDALGFAASGVYMPFAMKLKSVANAMPAIVSMIDGFRIQRRLRIDLVCWKAI